MNNLTDEQIIKVTYGKTFLKFYISETSFIFVSCDFDYEHCEYVIYRLFLKNYKKRACYHNAQVVLGNCQTRFLTDAEAEWFERQLPTIKNVLKYYDDTHIYSLCRYLAEKGGLKFIVPDMHTGDIPFVTEDINGNKIINGDVCFADGQAFVRDENVSQRWQDIIQYFIDNVHFRLETRIVEHEYKSEEI